jgi:hypothetical protein
MKTRKSYNVIVVLLLASCTTIQQQSTPIEDDSIDMEEFQPHYEYCKEFEFDPEIWMECMMNEQIRRNNIRRLA